MSDTNYTRRDFVKQNAVAGLGAAVAAGVAPGYISGIIGNADTPAILGGKKIFDGKWPVWPQWKAGSYEEPLLKAMRSGIWSRDLLVTEFEKKWAALIGTSRALAVVNGTNALITSVIQFDIGGGDEVLVTPYTWISSIQAVLNAGAIPVFVDIDPATYQMDYRKIEEKITPRTRAIMPVHILGMPANMEKIMEIAGKRDLLVIEDACQAWLAEINHKKVGTFGNAGCYSFQTSKHLPLGEGGAIVSNDEKFMDRCYSYHNVGFPYGAVIGGVGAGAVMLGNKLRITEYQAAIGLAQLEALVDQTETRNKSAAYLKAALGKIPGIVPYKLYDNVTKAAFHMFAFRYRKEEFSGLSRDLFQKALGEEGIPNLSGYAPYLNKQPYLEHAFGTKNFKRMYSSAELDFKKYSERNECPENDSLCNESVWLQQNMLLSPEQDLDKIAAAVERIRQNADKIRKLKS